MKPNSSYNNITVCHKTGSSMEETSELNGINGTDENRLGAKRKVSIIDSKFLVVPMSEHHNGGTQEKQTHTQNHENTTSPPSVPPSTSTFSKLFHLIILESCFIFLIF